MGGLPHNSLVKESHNKWNNANEYMIFFIKNIYQNQKNKDLPLLLISDTHKLISLWKKNTKSVKKYQILVS